MREGISGFETAILCRNKAEFGLTATAEFNIEHFDTPTVSPTPRLSPRSGPEATATTALAGAFNSLFKAELIRNKEPGRGINDLEIATAEYIDWFNHRRLHGEIGYRPPIEVENEFLNDTRPGHHTDGTGLTEPPTNSGQDRRGVVTTKNNARSLRRTPTNKPCCQSHLPQLCLRATCAIKRKSGRKLLGEALWVRSDPWGTPVVAG